MARMKGRAATALEAAASQVNSVSKNIDPKKAARMGIAHDPDSWFGTEIRIALKTLILKAWVKRTRIGSLTQSLACYSDIGPSVGRDGFIEIPEKLCNTMDCSLRQLLQSDRAALEKLRTISDAQSPSAEAARRSKVLTHLLKKGNDRLSPSDCRNLGDAVFAFFAPNTSAILTTNIRDHRPLAAAVGKTAISPKEVLAP